MGCGGRIGGHSGLRVGFLIPEPCFAILWWETEERWAGVGGRVECGGEEAVLWSGDSLCQGTYWMSDLDSVFRTEVRKLRIGVTGD
jgi:hypothetical protein